MRAAGFVAALALVACRRDAGHRAPPASVVADAAPARDAAAALPWRQGAIVPVNVDRDLVYVGAEALLADADLDLDLDLDAASPRPGHDGVATIAAPGHPLLGARLDGVTAAGAPCVAVVAGLIVVRTSGTEDEPRLALELAPGGGGQPVAVTAPGARPAVVFASVPVTPAVRSAVAAAVQRVPAFRDRAEPLAEVDLDVTVFEAGDGRVRAVAGLTAVGLDGCAFRGGAVHALFALTPGQAPALVGQTADDLFAPVVALVDRDRDGEPTVVFEGQAIDRGMEFAAHEGAVWDPRQPTAAPILPRSYYAGCD